MLVLRFFVVIACSIRVVSSQLSCNVGYEMENSNNSLLVTECPAQLRHCLRVEAKLSNEANGDISDVIMGSCASILDCKGSCIDHVSRHLELLPGFSISDCDVILCCSTHLCNRPSTDAIQATTFIDNLNATNRSQIVTSPGYLSGGDYPNNLNCAWRFIAGDEGDQVEIQFSDIMTEPCCDYVTVRDGDSIESPVLKEFRNEINLEHKFVSTFGSIYVTFVSDNSIAFQGFQITYRTVVRENSCTEELSANSTFQLVYTPNYPLPYPNNAYCLWIITAGSGLKVQLDILSLSIETCCDAILVRDGLDRTSPIMAYLAGRLRRPVRLTSTSNIIQVRFTSDQQATSRGMNASFKAVIIGRRPNGRVSSVTECGGSLEVPERRNAVTFYTISTPEYPKYHADFLACVWMLTALPGQRIRLWFSYVHTQVCCDFVVIRDGSSANSDKLAVISGYPEEFLSYVSSGRNMRVEFSSNFEKSGRGFNAFYETHLPGHDVITSRCGGRGRAVARLKYFASPNWPGTYPSDSRCVWYITAVSNRRSVGLFVLGTILERFADELSIRDGPLITSRRLATLTGKHPGRYYFVSTANHMTLIFQSNARINHGGFRAAYAQVARRST